MAAAEMVTFKSCLVDVTVIEEQVESAIQDANTAAHDRRPEEAHGQRVVRRIKTCKQREPGSKCHH